MKSNKHSPSSLFRKMSSSKLRLEGNAPVQDGENCLIVDGNASFQESCTVTARTLKRSSPFWSADVDNDNRRTLKMKTVEKKFQGQMVMISECSSTLLKKVDDVNYPRKCLGVTCPLNQKDLIVEPFHTRRLESIDPDNDECSVGSCSVISSSSSKLASPSLPGVSPDADTLSLDAESSYACRDEEEKSPIFLGEKEALRIHGLELHAYRCTLEALYACGPLNWEQEALLTNLRISLNISNDEHLMELRNLISAGTSIL